MHKWPVTRKMISFHGVIMKTSWQLLTKTASKWPHFLFSEFKCGHRVIFASRIKNRDHRPISVFSDYKDVRWKTIKFIIVVILSILCPAILWEEDFIMEFCRRRWNVCWLRFFTHWCCNQYIVKYNPCYVFLHPWCWTKFRRWFFNHISELCQRHVKTGKAECDGIGHWYQ